MRGFVGVRLAWPASTDLIWEAGLLHVSNDSGFTAKDRENRVIPLKNFSDSYGTIPGG